MPSITNTTGIHLSMATYLATNTYDYIPNTISTTELIKPVRQTILKHRVPQKLKTTDLQNLWKSRVGTSIHDGVESTWVNGHYKEAMKQLGHTDAVVDRVVVNSRELLEQYGYDERSFKNLRMYEGKLPKNPIPVFLEVRGFKEIQGVTLSGKFDFVGDGVLEDIKTTSAFTYVNNTKDEDYALQGSIYRFLHPKLITQDIMKIQFVFLDWKEFEAKNNPKYPAFPILAKEYPLMSLGDTEDYTNQRLQTIRELENKHQDELPLCSDTELWRKDPVWKYYKTPEALAQGKRSTKNFNNSAEAYQRLATDGGGGVIQEIKGEVIACKFCDAFPVCTQKDQLIADGSLKL